MVVLGIDVGKSDLYACLLRPELKPARQVVTNTILVGDAGRHRPRDLCGDGSDWGVLGAYCIEASRGGLPSECGQRRTDQVLRQKHVEAG